MARYFSLDYSGPRHAQLEGQYPLGSLQSPAWTCSECSRVLPGRTLESVRLGPTPIGPQPLAGSFGVGGLFARRAFLEAICGGEIDRHFRHAVVEAPNGQPHEDWLIVSAQNHLQVRGTDLPYYKYCRACGALLYLSRDETFLYPDPPSHVEVFQSGKGLVVPLRILPRVLRRRWPGLMIAELALPADPPDGYGDLPVRLDPEVVRRKGLDEFVGYPHPPGVPSHDRAERDLGL